MKTKHQVLISFSRKSRPKNFFLCSADGNYEVTLMTKATVYYTGLVVWQPPAVYKSSCAIDVEFFPYDVQTCVLKLGSWTYDGFKVRVLYASGARHIFFKFLFNFLRLFSIFSFLFFFFCYVWCVFWNIVRDRLKTKKKYYSGTAVYTFSKKI